MSIHPTITKLESENNSSTLQKVSITYNCRFLFKKYNCVTKFSSQLQYEYRPLNEKFLDNRRKDTHRRTRRDQMSNVHMMDSSKSSEQRS